MKIIAVLAMTESLLIGSRGWLPWHLPEDMQRFKGLTMGCVVVMGKNTYYSLPERFRPLPGRRNIVVTRSHIDGVETFADIDSLVSTFDGTVEKIFIIWGATIYDQFFEKWLIDQVELTLIHGDYTGDIYVKEFREWFISGIGDTKENCTFFTLKRS